MSHRSGTAAGMSSLSPDRRGRSLPPSRCHISAALPGMNGSSITAVVASPVTSAASTSSRRSCDSGSRASFQGLVDDSVARVNWSRPCDELDRLIRGCDPQPGAFAQCGGGTVRFFDAVRVEGGADAPAGTIVAIEEGRLVIAAEGGRISVGRVRIADGKKVPAGEAGLAVGERLG